MKLFLISQDQNNGYDTYDSASRNPYRKRLRRMWKRANMTT